MALTRHMDRTLRTVRNLTEATVSAMLQTETETLTSEAMVALVSDRVFERDTYRRLPAWAKQQVVGAFDGLRARIWRVSVAFSYYTDAGRLTVNSDAYRAMSAREICEKWGKSGAHVWRSALPAIRFFTLPEESPDRP